MTKYEFTLILKGAWELTEEMADKPYDAGWGGGTGVVFFAGSMSFMHAC